MSDLPKHTTTRTKPASSPLSRKDEKLLRYSIAFAMVFYVCVAIYIARLFRDSEASRQAVDFLLEIGDVAGLLNI